ncbi:cell filamentation protein Fic, partial [Vibrio parahaemolyticus]
MAEKNQHNDIIFYSTPSGNVKIEVIFNDETFWLTQKAMAELFGVKVPAVSKHLTNIFETRELE